MKAFIQRNLFAVAIAFLGLILTTAICATTPAGVVLTSQADTRMKSGLCNTPACALRDDSWSATHYECPSIGVDGAAVNSVLDNLLSSPEPVDTTSELPSFLQGGTCESSAKVASVSHGEWKMFYTVTKKCNCKEGQVPTCSEAIQVTDDACNVAHFRLCGVVTADESAACPAK
ncbi:hypothetical protein CROQUDRAFT_131233 [Cronartium quercuum f. sp. fusiforme G11]|uniref:Uncharacterized protein n=1 Tax=Cronartium quercuum f. sp. fusiforme G11 TaxID=708437 RepID=A0A9P6NU11_9BASI|nr:hypothetical protein CROQUDRAFT_131233 [Cronartium quercuum f. sp. fusiforme G11]